MAEHETIADIIAEKRRRADELEASSYRPHQFLRERIAELRQEADRLEAAWKRDTKELRAEIERLKEERNYSGVRERERLRANGFAIVPKEQLECGDAAKLREALKAIGGLCTGLMPTWDGAIGRIKDIAEVALSAPPRNCDLPEVAKDPWRAWLDDKSNWDEFGSPKLEIHDWLFAPATEKEGGDK